MITSDRAFPHPVLSPFRDDVFPNDFAMELQVGGDADNFYLFLTFALSNPTLTGLIGEGKASLGVHVECKRNFFRRLFPLRSASERIVISSSELVGRVEVSGFVNAAVPLFDYRVSGCHADYDGFAFTVDRGDVLALTRTVFFDAYVDYDPLKNINSILTIRRSEEMEDGPLVLETSGDKLIATLSKSDYDHYVELRGDPALGPLLANQVAFPVLIESVHELKNTPEDDVEIEMAKRWYRSIAMKLTTLGINIRRPDASAIEAAQALLSLPLRRSLAGLFTITDIEGAA